MESNVYFGFYFPIEWTGSYRATFTVADVAGNKSLRVTSMFDAP
ncbi:MAG: hypothetical protein M5R36_07370 [Deltaproteobacteria bacterium]|nr:hypothetical protein [Deltaproteobacteria bacterium]